MEEINQKDIQQILEHFSKNLYRAKEADTKSEEMLQKCLKLVALDYSHVVISNNGGELSAHYPSKLIIFENELSVGGNGAARPTEPPRTTGTIYENMYDATKLRDLFTKSRFARCRARFPIPVILYRGKQICRSSTLSGGPEIYGRSGLDYLFSGSENTTEEDDELLGTAAQTPRDWQLFDRVRSQDIRLLKTLNVGTIIDFMVEKKKVKFGMNVTSSEKVDKENRYSEFTIVSLPYPGCEFFKEYRNNNYVAKGLIFDWSQSHVDAVIGVPDDPISSQLKIDWEKYKIWDLVKLTQNYLKLILRYLQESSKGLLVHCISGWDRTPLFISLLRLSLWADGAIHQSLSASQILYFTIAYDWMLFGHNLMDRLSKGEDIFFFCFYILKSLVSDEYSVCPRQKVKQNVGASSGSGSSLGNPSSSVLRNDSDLHLDSMLFDIDCAISSQGSNISLNSSCSSVSSKSHDNPPILFQNVPEYSEEHSNGNIPYYNNQSTWPPLVQPSPFETSPIPMAAYGNICSPRSPHANRTSPVAVPVTSRLRQGNDSNTSLSIGRCEGQISADSSTTVIEDDCFIYHSGPSDNLTLRMERLQTVRTLFYNSYCSTIGFKFNSGQDSGLGSLLGNFAEKVGIISSQKPNV